MGTDKSTKKKQAFDFARNSMWSINPLDLCIIGGASLPDDERGPLDTDDGPEHHLYDPRIEDALPDAFVANIEAVGVDVPISIAKINDQATVVAGRRRVRAARRANIARAAKGLPLIMVDAKMRRDDNAGHFGAMIRENEQRANNDVLAKIDMLKRYLKFGSEDQAALEFGVTSQAIRSWLNYEDNALTATKKAVEQGKIGWTTGLQLARTKDPEEQAKALEEVLKLGVVTDGRVSQREAKLAARGTTTRGKAAGVADKKTQRKFLTAVQEMPHPNASEKTLAYWEGVEQGLKLVLGDDDVDNKLAERLSQVHSLMATEKRARRDKATKRAAKKSKAEAAETDAA